MVKYMHAQFEIWFFRCVLEIPSTPVVAKTTVQSTVSIYVANYVISTPQYFISNDF
jgi:hypothetical protein